jgi:hypothetical protein
MAATVKRLAEAAYELEAFQPNLTRAEADLRIAMLTAKLKVLDGLLFVVGLSHYCTGKA